MEIKTYTTLLTEICDYFDSLISPKTILRSDTNIVYLMFKAIAKGWEVINNICVVLNNKFNPAYCTDTDLESTASLVGTAKLAGSVSGLLVTVTNNSEQPKTLTAGTYTYAFDADTNFTCTITADLTIPANEYANLTFLSDVVGSFPVTMQQTIEVTSEESIPPELNFSCADNDNLLGYLPETNLEFRKRILSDTERQDVINELKIKLRNLPYVYDCEIIFNRDTSSVSYGEFTIPPYYMLIVMSCAVYKDEIAQIVAESAVYPTVEVDGESHQVNYENAVFASGSYPVYINDFTDKEFDATITYKADASYISSQQAQEKIRTGLITAINTNVHRDAITTEEIFNILNDLDIAGVSIYGVQLYVDNNQVTYVDCLRTEIGKLQNVTFSEVA